MNVYIIQKQFLEKLKLLILPVPHIHIFRQGPTVTSTNVILEIISHGCTNKEVVRQSIKNLIAVGKLELTLKTSATDFTFKIVRGKIRIIEFERARMH